MRKLAFVSLSISLASIVWFGCSSTNVITNGNPEGGTGTDTGTGTDSGGGADGGGTDSTTTTDAKKDIEAPSGPFVDLAYGTCPALTGCGGDPKGRWNVSGGCVADTVFDDATKACPTIVISNVKFQARGYVDADAVSITRATEVKLSADFSVPSSCKAAVGTCATIAAAIQSIGQIDKATCADDASGGCDCAVEDTQLESSTNGYTTSSNSLTTNGSPAQTYAYCVAANKVSYQETTGGTPKPYVVEMTK